MLVTNTHGALYSLRNERFSETKKENNDENWFEKDRKQKRLSMHTDQAHSCHLFIEQVTNYLVDYNYSV